MTSGTRSSEVLLDTTLATPCLTPLEAHHSCRAAHRQPLQIVSRLGGMAGAALATHATTVRVLGQQLARSGVLGCTNRDWRLGLDYVVDIDKRQCRVCFCTRTASADSLTPAKPTLPCVLVVLGQPPLAGCQVADHQNSQDSSYVVPWCTYLVRATHAMHDPHPDLSCRLRPQQWTSSSPNSLGRWGLWRHSLPRSTAVAGVQGAPWAPS